MQNITKSVKKNLKPGAKAPKGLKVKGDPYRPTKAKNTIGSRKVAGGKTMS